MFILGIQSHRFVLLSFAYLFLVLIPIGGCLFFIKSSRLHRVFSNKALWLGCIVLFSTFDEVRYVQRILRHPEKSTSAPALMQPAANLLSGKYPYAVRLPGGAPVSPGPGWIILLAPLTLAGGAGLITGLSACLVAFLIAKKYPEGGGVFVLFIFLQPVLIEISARGTDLFSIPILYAALCLLAERWSGKALSLICLGAVAGLFAQSRIPMVSLLLILGLGVWRRDRRDAIFLMIPATVVCVAMYAFFYLWTVHDHIFFQPLHLLHRERLSGLASSIVGPTAGMILVLFILFKMKGHAEQWILAGGLLLLVVFAPTGIGELRAAWPHMEFWEGANYLSFGMSLIATYLALNIARPSRFEAV